MAGRGTDKYSNKDFVYGGKKDDEKEIKKNEEKVKSLGGLFIIGTERHESRRIDNQLRGRSGMTRRSWKYNLFYKLAR